jgi:hypothetical protein
LGFLILGYTIYSGIFHEDLIGFNDDIMEFNEDLMGFNEDLMGFNWI